MSIAAVIILGLAAIIVLGVLMGASSAKECSLAKKEIEKELELARIKAKEKKNEAEAKAKADAEAEVKAKEAKDLAEKAHLHAVMDKLGGKVLSIKTSNFGGIYNNLEIECGPTDAMKEMGLASINLCKETEVSTPGFKIKTGPGVKTLLGMAAVEAAKAEGDKALVTAIIGSKRADAATHDPASIAAAFIAINAAAEGMAKAEGGNAKADATTPTTPPASTKAVEKTATPEKAEEKPAKVAADAPDDPTLCKRCGKNPAKPKDGGGFHNLCDVCHRAFIAEKAAKEGGTPSAPAAERRVVKPRVAAAKPAEPVESVVDDGFVA